MGDSILNVPALAMALDSFAAHVLGAFVFAVAIFGGYWLYLKGCAR
jgi:hypothetical protein